ncbi:MAG: 8-oxo-dGTP diphosphatase [Acidobacteriota bacterium]
MSTGGGAALGPETRVATFDWQAWRPTDRATLVFVCRDGEILLIRKKRGLGAGKINGPGGRLDPGETPAQCAVREAQEELHVTPLEVQLAGRLSFQFLDGYGLDVHVFSSHDCLGEARETDEAIPLWTPVDRIPFDEMWEDDRLWLPHMLAGRPFRGRFLFDGDSMVDHALELVSSDELRAGG